MNNYFLLFCSLKPRSRVRILTYRNSGPIKYPENEYPKHVFQIQDCVHCL